MTRRALLVLAAAIPAAMIALIIIGVQNSTEGDALPHLSPKVIVAKNEWSGGAVGRVVARDRSRVGTARAKKAPPPKILRRRPGGPLWTPETILANAESDQPPRKLPPVGEPVAARQPYLEAEPARFEAALIAITEPLGVQVYVDGRLIGKTPLARPLRGDARLRSIVLRSPDLVEQRHEVSADQNGRFYVFARMHPVDERR